MIVKDIRFGDQARQALIEGINKIADAVKTTLGARGNTVLIESEQHVGGITVTKDGVTVANSINLMDPTENLAVRMMKEASAKTASEAGDGTTTAIVLAQALIHEWQNRVKEGMNQTEIIRAIQKTGDYIVELLNDSSKKVSGSNLNDVATVSANNDIELGDIIAQAYERVGVSGVVTVEDSDGKDTSCSVTEGVRVSRGYDSRYYITDKRQGVCELNNPYVMVLDQDVDNMLSIEHALADILNRGRAVLIIGHLKPEVINALNLNRTRNHLKVCSIQPPQFGWKSKELMEDLALVTGATYFSESTGDNLQLVREEDLGQCEKVVVSADDTVIIRSDDRQAVIDEHLKQLWVEHDGEKDKDRQAFIKERIAILSGRIGIIHVGAGSDIELKEKRDRVDDAVCATRAALEDGILPGGGVALRDLAKIIGGREVETMEERVAGAILETVLKAPYHQILTNAGMEDHSKDQKRGYGIDVKVGKSGGMIKMGIIDPTKVTKSAVTNAISVATTILSTNAIITNVRQQ